MAARAKERSTVEKRVEAMRHPLRRAILRHIIEAGETSAVEVSWVIDEPLYSISHHVRVLADLGCLEKTRTEQVRGAIKTFYVATERHLIDDDEWDDLDPEIREGLLVDFMQPLVDDFSRAARSGTLGGDQHWHITRIPVAAVDREGYKEMLIAHRELYDRIAQIQTESLQRMAETDEEPIKVSSGQTCFRVDSFV